MKRIIGFENKGGMTLKKELEIQDEELKSIIGKKGLIKLELKLKRDIRYINLGKSIGIPANQALDGIQEIIDEAILEQSNRI